MDVIMKKILTSLLLAMMLSSVNSVAAESPKYKTPTFDLIFSKIKGVCSGRDDFNICADNIIEISILSISAAELRATCNEGIELESCSDVRASLGTIEHLYEDAVKTRNH